METHPEKKAKKPIPQVMFDGNAPRIGLFVWLDDGTCHQVSMNMSDRAFIGKEILRKHSFCLKVLANEVPLEWRAASKDADELETEEGRPVPEQPEASN